MTEFTTISTASDTTRVASEEAVTMARGLLDRVDLEKVTSYYTGRSGCACGCRGTYRYLEHHVESEGKRRGYEVTSDEVTTMRSVRSLMTRLRNRLETHYLDYMAVWDDCLSFDIEGRTYTIYTTA